MYCITQKDSEGSVPRYYYAKVLGSSEYDTVIHPYHSKVMMIICSCVNFFVS